MGVRQIDLPRAIGFKDPNTIKNYEMERLPRLQVLVRLASGLEVTVEWILVGGKQ
jgi:hypothetical protein